MGSVMQKKKTYNIAIVGTRGAVGTEMRQILEERDFPVGEIRFFGSARSKGAKISFNGSEHEIKELQCTKADFEDLDIVLSSAGSSISKQFVDQAVSAGAVVIDNTSAFRMDPNVPLVIPEVNPEAILEHKGIIANPNCSTIIMLVPIFPLAKHNRVKRINVATYQSASGAGIAAMRELRDQVVEWSGSEDSRADVPVSRDNLKREALPHQIAFNVFSHNSAVGENGYNEEEDKMINETRKIFKDAEIGVNPTCIRVPVLRAHSEAITAGGVLIVSLNEVEIQCLPTSKRVHHAELIYRCKYFHPLQEVREICFPKIPGWLIQWMSYGEYMPAFCSLHLPQ